MARRHLSPQETREAIDLLIRHHNFRIGIEVYQRVLAEIDASRAE